MRRGLGLAAAVVLAFGAALVGASAMWARPADAHAVVITSSPAAGQVVVRAPGEVWVQFSEPVSAAEGALRVLDSQGRRVDLGSSESSGREVLSSQLEGGLGDGTYVIDYRVISADGHPVAGAIVFGVGEGTAIDSGVAAAADPDERALEVAAGFARFFTYVGALGAAGLGLFLAFFLDGRGLLGARRWDENDLAPSEGPSAGAEGESARALGTAGPDLLSDPRRSAAPLVRAGALLGALGAVVVVGIQAALVTGDGWSAAFDADSLRRALGDGLGWSTAVLLVGLAGVHVSAHLRGPTGPRVLAFYGWLAVAASFALWGHTGTAEPRWLGVGADVVHTAAAAVWLGGLVGMGVVLVVRGRAAKEPSGVRALATDTAEVVVRFSDAAALTVTALVVAGVALAVTQVSSLGQLTSTTYGLMLLVKVLLVAVVLAVAAYNRWRLRPSLESEPQAWRKLTRTVGAEVLVLLAAVAVTSALVVTTPARTAGEVAPVAAFSAPLATGGTVNITVVPADVGPNVAHVQYFDDVGRPMADVRSVEVQVVPEGGDIGPITTTATRAGPGHFIANGVQVPRPGTWELTFVARVGDFDQDRSTFPLSVG